MHVMQFSFAKVGELDYENFPTIRVCCLGNNLLQGSARIF